MEPLRVGAEDGLEAGEVDFFDGISGRAP